MTAVVKRSRGGRHSKGLRDELMARPPMEVGVALRQRAEDLGVTISDLVSALIAREVGLGHIVPMPTDRPNQLSTNEVVQEAVPLRSA